MNVKRRMVLLRDTKNGEDRAVPLSKDALAIVLRLLDGPKDPQLFPVSLNALRSAWCRILKRADIENCRFHDLRHEATSRLFERGLSAMEVQSLLVIYRRMRAARSMNQ